MQLQDYLAPLLSCRFTLDPYFILETQNLKNRDLFHGKPKAPLIESDLIFAVIKGHNETSP